MSFRGALATLPLMDVLQVLSHGKKTGALHLRRGPVSKCLFFETGIIVSTTSDDPTEYLGQFLLSRGLISEEQLRQALAAQEESELYLGKILVQMGAIGKSRLGNALVAKTEETVYSLFDWQEGVFDFRPGEKAHKHIPVSLQVQHVILKGIERNDKRREIREVFRDSSVVLRLSDKPPTKAAQGPAAKQVWSLIDGRRSIADICLAVHSSEFAVSRFLLELYRQGFLEIGDPPPKLREPESPVTHSVEEGQALLEQGEPEKALRVFRRAQQLEPERRVLRSLVELAEIRVVERAYQEILPPRGILCLNCPPQTLMEEILTPEEFFLLSRIDGRVDVKGLVRISPLREVEVVQIVSLLMRKGLITVELKPSDAS